MGQYISKPGCNAEELVKQTTPLSIRKHARVLTLSSLDPRSPTTDIPRTPIQLLQAEISSASTDSMSQDFGELDPRSPTRAFQRTPIPIGKLSEDPELSLGSVEISATISGSAENPKILDAGAFPSPVPAANAKERKCKLQKENGSGKELQLPKKAPEATRGDRLPLKATSRPNTLLRSLHQKQLYRHKTDVSGSFEECHAQDDKENRSVFLTL